MRVKILLKIAEVRVSGIIFYMTKLKNELKKYSLHTLNIISDFIFPNICFYCRDFVDTKQTLCDGCLETVCAIVSKTVYVTPKYPVKVFAISDYKDPIRSLILSKGYSDIVTSRRLGELIWDMTNIRNVDFDFIIPIPLHWSRFATRGFNQAQAIASVISKKSGKKMIKILKRKKMTKRQSGLTSKKRLENLTDAFSLCVKGDDCSAYKGKSLLIVDDLMTTGSTIKVAAKKLIALKPKSISAAVACRVV